MNATKAVHLPALRRLPRISAVAAVSILLLVGMAGYFGLLGVRYLSASNAIQSLEQDLEDFSRQTRGTLPDDEALNLELESQEQQLGDVRDVFEYRTTGQLTGLLSSTARSSGVELLSVTAGEVSSVVQEGVQYRTQPVNIALRAATADIYRYLSAVREEAHAVAVTGFRMTGLDGVPSAQVEVLFFMSPEEAPKETPVSVPGSSKGIMAEDQDR